MKINSKKNKNKIGRMNNLKKKRRKNYYQKTKKI